MAEQCEQHKLHRYTISHIGKPIQRAYNTTIYYPSRAYTSNDAIVYTNSVKVTVQQSVVEHERNSNSVAGTTILH